MIFSARTRELLAEQQQRYFRSLPQKRAQIERCWETIQVNGPTSANTDEFRLHVHRLAGSAGSYGLGGVGDAAKQLDLVLGSGAHVAVDWQTVESTMAELLQQFDQILHFGSVV